MTFVYRPGLPSAFGLFDRALEFKFCYYIFVFGGPMPRLTDAELSEIRRRRPGVRASLAFEGMYLTPAQQALFDQMDRKRLTPRKRANLITHVSRATPPNASTTLLPAR